MWVVLETRRRSVTARVQPQRPIHGSIISLRARCDGMAWKLPFRAGCVGGEGSIASQQEQEGMVGTLGVGKNEEPCETPSPKEPAKTGLRGMTMSKKVAGGCGRQKAEKAKDGEKKSQKTGRAPRSLSQVFVYLHS